MAGMPKFSSFKGHILQPEKKFGRQETFTKIFALRYSSKLFSLKNNIEEIDNILI